LQLIDELRLVVPSHPLPVKTLHMAMVRRLFPQREDL